MTAGRSTGLIVGFFLADPSDSNVTEQVPVNNVSC